jgi:hypothetical protein
VFWPAFNCKKLWHLKYFKLNSRTPRVGVVMRWVQTGKARCEHIFSALPPTSDIARQPRLTIESHLRLNPPASRCRAAGGCRLSTSPLAGPRHGHLRPDIKCTQEVPTGTRSVRANVEASFGLARGALSVSASRRVHSINPQPSTGSTISSVKSPHQRVNMIGRVSCPAPIEVAGEG